jgi:hypothetical protein
MLPPTGARPTAARPTEAPAPTERRSAVTSQVRDQRHTLEPVAAWTAILHPDTWRIIEDEAGRAHLLPATLKIPHKPGVGGVGLGRDRDGRPVPAVAEAIKSYTEQGFVAVPAQPVRAFGADLPDYCCRWEGRNGATHLWAWQRVRVIHTRSQIEVDRDAHVAALSVWMRTLLGFDEAPSEVEALHRETARRKFLELSVEARTNPRRLTELDILARRMKSLGWPAPQLPSATITYAQPAATARAPEPAPDQSTELAQLRAQLAAMSAQLASLTAAPAASPAAPPPAQGVVVGSPSAAEAALPFLDEGSAPKPKTPKG